MNAIDVKGLGFQYGGVTALQDLDLSVPQGALYALLGPNGSGKTTLLQIIMGLRRPRTGRVSLLGIDRSALTWRDRMSIGYVAEGQSLPPWMRLEEIEAYLAPLYPSWDRSLAHELRDRFALDPRRHVRTLSRGEHMKAALLLALAPRPRLLLMDEPFTGMDALVKDDLVRGLLESAGAEGWTVLLCSHDIGELELLADWVGILDRGRITLSEPMDALRERFKRVELTLHDDRIAEGKLPRDWLCIERAGARLSFLTSRNGESVEDAVRSQFPHYDRMEVRGASLREVFVAIAKRPPRAEEVAA